MPDVLSSVVGSGAQPGPAAVITPLLDLRGVGKSFGAVRALADVDLSVRAGEVVALVGDNGAGKSTLVKTIAGVHEPDTGGIFVEGQSVRISSPAAATSLGIATVYQDLALCENLDVTANLFLGKELAKSPLFGRLRRLSDDDMQSKAVEVLAGLAVSLPALGLPVAALSGGQRQSVAVARAVLWGSKLVLLDEPTAALGVEQTHLVLELIERLRQRGLGVLLISHNLADIFDVADRIVVLRLGRIAGDFDARTTDVNTIVTAITGGHELRRRLRTPLVHQPTSSVTDAGTDEGGRR